MKLKIDGKFIKFFTAGSISLKLDSVASTFGFAARFNPDNDEHKRIFKPLQYYKVEIFNKDDKLILTGEILNTAFSSNERRELPTISGYSLPGRLEDVTIPPSLYPLESNNRNLKDIASRLCGAFGVGLVIDPSVANDVGKVYKNTVASPTDTVKGYIAKLTSQRNILLTHDAAGRLVMFKPNTHAQSAYNFTAENSLNMSATYNGQSLHSQISIVRQPSAKNVGASTVDTIQNHLIGVYRPTTKILSSGEDTDTRKAADNELATELKAITINVQVAGLMDNLRCGQIVSVSNPEIYVYEKTRYIIDGIDLKFDEQSESTSFSLSLPETYTGETPKKIF